MAAIKGKKLNPIACPLCGFSSKRITAIEEHICSAHGKTAKQLYDELNGGPCLCACGCGKETTWLNWKHGYSRLLKGHNASIYSIYSPDKAAEIAMKRGSNWRGKTSHWRGRTKETDERVAARGLATSAGRKRAIEEGKIIIWSKGKTKETDPRINALANVLRQGYADGTYVPWAKGKSKETDERIAQMADKVALTRKTIALRQRLDELKRLSEAEIRDKIEAEGKFKIISDLTSYVNDATPNIQVACSSCGAQAFGSLRQLKYHRCYNCDPAGSAAQEEIAAFIESLGFKVDRNIRNIIQGTHRCAELDIYVASKKLAIEYNGLYWHCNIHKADNYHQNKSDQCRAAGIKLIHVFQDEWFTRRHIVESMIKNRLGLTPNKIGARECNLVQLSQAEKTSFFNANHIDGDAASMIAYGLKHNDELVMAISLRKPFYKKHNTALEVARICSATDTQIMGGLARLSKQAKIAARELNFSKLISYVDTRHGSDGSAWSTTGWIKTGETPPRFWWTDNNQRFNRFNKEKNLTETQVAALAGVTRIYGCKNLIFELSTIDCIKS